MFIGSTYVRRDLKEKYTDPTMLGYSRIKIMDRVLSRTETRTRHDDGKAVSVTVYYYTLMCLVDRWDPAEIMEDDLSSEIISGYYVMEPDRGPS
jgi:hypothetical protein